MYIQLSGTDIDLFLPLQFPPLIVPIAKKSKEYTMYKKNMPGSMSGLWVKLFGFSCGNASFPNDANKFDKYTPFQFMWQYNTQYIPVIIGLFYRVWRFDQAAGRKCLSY